MIPSRCAVVFDWNGTVLADTALCLRANNETFVRLGLPRVGLKRFRDVYDVPLVQMYKALGADPQEVLRRKDELSALFIDTYEPNAPKLRARRGVRTALAQLRKDGYKLVVLSNYIVEKIAAQAARLNLAPFFDEILANGQEATVYQKGGKGARLKRFIETHGIEKALVVGDTPEEIEIAHSYGYLGVALTGGVGSLARLRAARPDFLIHTLGELPALAAKAFGKEGA